MIGIDDGPFEKGHRGDVPLIGAVFASHRLDGVVYGRVRRDGRNATDAIVRLVATSRFDAHIRCVLLQGITLAGFNVVDLAELHARLHRPIIAVARRAPNLPAMRRALLSRVPGGARKWSLLAAAPPMVPMAGVHAQALGISPRQVEATLRFHASQSKLPEPLRVAHLLGAALVRGHSHGQA